MADKKMLKVKLVKSMFGRGKKHMACVKGLGLRRMHHVVEVEDTPAVRGMIHKVHYLLEWEQV
jgi:large subunit ribosomal protein L30